MKNSFAVLFLSVLLFSSISFSQTKAVVGGKVGLSVLSGESSSESGFLLGPMAELLLNHNMAIGTEFNINTQAGTPIEWANYFKYYFDVQQTNIKPYVNGGLDLWFYTGGPYFGLRFGGGANFQIAPNLYIPADVQLGPVFATGSTLFYLSFTSGVRYYLN